MLYTPMVNKAIKIMFETHKHQLDKSGVPYVFHPFHLAEQMTDENTVITALLHDTIEDGSVTEEFLAKQGFSDEVIKAVALLTHDKSEDYFDYVKRVKSNPIAVAVKLADLRHNSDLSRLEIITDKDKARAEKYRRAIEILESDDL